jgi:hypothetical protein
MGDTRPRSDAGTDVYPLIRSFVVRPLGFEPRTCGLRVRCSAVELEAQCGLPSVWLAGCEPNTRLTPVLVRRRRGAPHWNRVTDGARTRDPQYHKLMLYQLSYDHHEVSKCATAERRLHIRCTRTIGRVRLFVTTKSVVW